MAEPRWSANLRQMYEVLGEPRDRLTDGELLQRYVAGDQGAFTALVRRHGSMVYGICRRGLHNRENAEDAFQATFLALAIRAGKTSWGASVAGWLHEVAFRVATKTRVAAARRTAHEREAAQMRLSQVPAMELDEQSAIVDAELQLLPGKLRDPLVLCYLQNLTAEQAACRLGCSPRTVERRLNAGRAALGRRLRRRGIESALVLLAMGRDSVSAASDLVTGTVQLAQAFKLDRALVALGPQKEIIALTMGVLRAMQISSMKSIVLALITACVLTAGGLGAAARWVEAPPGVPVPEIRPGRKPGASGPMAVDRQGDALPPGALARMGTERLRQPGRVAEVGFAPGGAALICAAHGADALYLWDPATGRELRHLEGLQVVGPVSNFATDAQFRLLAAPARGNAVRLWDVDSGKLIKEFQGHRGPVAAVALTPDGSTLASVAGDGTLRLWDVARGQEIRQFPIAANLPMAGSGFVVGFSPGGRILAIRQTEPMPGRLPLGRLKLVDVATGRELSTLHKPGHDIDWAAFSPDASIVATSALAEPVARLWDTATGKETGQVRGRKGPGGPVALSVDGKTLLTAFDGQVQLWDLASKNQTTQVPMGPGILSYLSLAPDGKTLAAGTATSGLRLWDVRTGKELHRAGHTAGILSVGLSPSGILTTADSGSQVRWWRVENGEPLGTFDGLRHQEYLPVVAPDGRMFATAQGQRLITLRDTTNAKVIRRFSEPQTEIVVMVFSPDGRALASVGRDQSLVVWDVNAGKKRRVLTGAQGWPFHLAFSPDGRTLAAVCWRPDMNSRTLQAWDLSNGRQLYTVPAPDLCGAITYAPDGKTLAIAGPNWRILLYEARSGRELRTLQPTALPPGPHSALTVAFGPDGHTLAAAGTDRTVRLFELSSGLERQAFPGHRHQIQALIFSADGSKLVSGSEDGTALVWTVQELTAAKPATQQSGTES